MFIGGILVVMAYGITEWKSTIFHLCMQVTGMVSGPMAGLFILGILFPFVNTQVGCVFVFVRVFLISINLFRCRAHCYNEPILDNAILDSVQVAVTHQVAHAHTHARIHIHAPLTVSVLPVAALYIRRAPVLFRNHILEYNII